MTCPRASPPRSRTKPARHGHSSALAIVILWAVSGPLFGFSDTWQLVINTGTTVVTFLMVFLIQRAQNKDTLAVQLKLNELVAAIDAANNRLISVEDLSEGESSVSTIASWPRWPSRKRS